MALGHFLQHGMRKEQAPFEQVSAITDDLKFRNITSHTTELMIL